ncbi:hypothetical protein ACWC9T_17405 [Kitasatospora sp. NPDC001159]
MPSWSATVLGARQLRRPLWRGAREWDLVAARWRYELLRGRRDDLQPYRDTYTAHGRADVAVPYGHIGAWSGYQVVRDVGVPTAVATPVGSGIRDGLARTSRCAGPFG